MTYFIITLLVYVLYLLVRMKKALHMLQQNAYNRENRFFRWIVKNLGKVFLTIDILVLMLPVISIISGNDFGYLLIGVLLFILLRYNISSQKKEQTKKPLVYTSRAKRLIVTYLIITFAILFIIILNYDVKNEQWYYLVLALYVYLSYFVLYVINFINMPVEKLVYWYYYNKATTKREAMANLKVIGVTGSYGKTSSKNVVSTILAQKYRVLPSPKSYNTAFGLMRTINENLTKFDEIFVAEMAAVRNHKISELAKIVKPDYAIITKIGVAHLETFKTEENILNTKFELVESLDENGVAILNADDEKQVNYKIKSKCKIIWIGIDNDADVRATDIKYNHEGSTFNVIFKGDKKKYSFTTCLLGYANVYNILAGIALAKEFGLSIKEIQAAVKKIEQVEHRLQLKDMGNNLYIIDDAFNSNPVGSKMALDVLKIMPGKRVIVTPGMIELGAQEEEKNYEFGYHMASCVDIAILVGEKQTKPIYSGLIKGGFNKDNIYVINDVKKAFDIVNKIKDGKTYMLLENDLPDLFNEK